MNSPAISRVLQRWTAEPQREVWLALVETREERAPLGEEVTLALRALGSEPYLIEAVSKVLALLVPDDVPLMPLPARTFVLGKACAREESSFVAMVEWFRDVQSA